MPALVFSAVFAALYAAHQVGDHWPSTACGAFRKGLTSAQAVAAGLHRHAGPVACAVHVATYTATGALFLVLLAWRSRRPPTTGRIAAAPCGGCAAPWTGRSRP